MVVDARQLRVLKAEIQSDLRAIRRLDEAVAEARPTDLEKEPPKVVRSGLALYLRHFYEAVEQIFLRVARALDHFQPTGETWHRDLLEAAALEIEGIRPPIISETTRVELERYRSFRHIVRHAYEREFLWKSMKDLVADYPEVSRLVRADVETFLAVLDQMIRQLESDDEA